MKPRIVTISLSSLFIASAAAVCAQTSVTPATSDPSRWQAFNREATHQADHVYLDAKANDGVLWLKDVEFSNGTIEFEVKGKDVRGQSFVGVAFHGRDDRTFDVVYFRPFNFLSPERKAHAVQYVSMPANDWSTLRASFPGKYENAITPPPDPEAWFRVRVVVKHPLVAAYVNGADEPCLQINQLSDRKHGRVGLWVGNGSDGSFRNFRLTHSD